MGTPNKYIVFDVPGLPESGIIFPPWLEHAQIRNQFPNWTPLGAGSVEVFHDKILVSGYSQSLNLGPRPDGQDAYAMRMLVDT